MSKLLIFMTPDRKNSAAIQQRRSSLMAGSLQRDIASKIPVIVPARGRAVAAMPRPISASSEIGPAPLTTYHANKSAQSMPGPNEPVTMAVMRELGSLRLCAMFMCQDQHRQSGKPRRQAEHQQR